MHFERFSGWLLLLWSLTAAAAETGTNRWEAEIRAFEASDRIHPPPKQAILFIGSSSIRLWKSLAQDFPDLPVINRGFGGSQIIDAVQFVDRIVRPYEPRQIVMYCGGNDLNAGKTPEQVFADFKAFVAKVHATLPQTRLTYIAIAPNPARWAQVERIQAANQLITGYCREHPKLTFLDVFPHMLGDDGAPRPEIFSADRLHMNAQGYALWTKLLRPYLH